MSEELIQNRFGFLSGNALKFLAAVSMLIDHIGYLFFPRVTILRVIGRLAFPIFAYMIAEGCRYTRSKRRYLLTVFSVGMLCQIVYWAYERSFRVDLNVLLTFTFSILLIYALQFAKAHAFSAKESAMLRVLPVWLFVALLLWVALFTLFVHTDYGFCGCVLPLFAAVLHPVDGHTAGRWDKPVFVLPLFAIGVLLLSLSLGGYQYAALLALIPLFFYSGKRGTWRTKYFFYIFYPAHLLLLQIVAWIVSMGGGA